MIGEIKDRVGIGWRPDLAAGILSNLDKIDLVEVVADDYFGASHAKVRSLKTLASQVPVVLHGVSLGMASSESVDSRRLQKMARLLDEIRPECWSEHLAFVRAGGVEIGHLAMPPRTGQTVEGAAENIEAAKSTTGARPLLENIATLIDPPGSSLSEVAWIASILEASGCDLLLDLHNLYANATNFDYDPVDFIRHLPAERIAAIHLSGGKWIKAPNDNGHRLLDDHLHDVPDAVYNLLQEVAARAIRPLTVILERDGNYPSMENLLQQLSRAREALANGRFNSSGLLTKA